MFDNMFNGMFGKIGQGMCRLTMDGKIAVKTNNGYKSYNMNTGNLTNCSGFAFDVGDEFFFCLPTNKVAPGDIVLINGKPKCVIESTKKTLTVVNYEDGTIETVLPERHVFMGETYFYGKIVSMFGTNGLGKGKNGFCKLLKYKMMLEMFGKGNSNNSMGNLPLMMMMSGGENNMFDGMFDFENMFDNSDESEDVDISEDEE